MRNRWNALMEFTPVAIVIFDKNMNIIDATNNWLERYSISRASVIGKYCYDLFPNLPLQWRDVHQRCLGGAVEKSDNDILTMPDGRKENVRWEIRPYKDENGEIQGIIMFSEIITNKVTSDAKVVRLNKILQLLNGIREIAIRSDDEFNMLEHICREFVESGDYKLA